MIRLWIHAGVMFFAIESALIACNPKQAEIWRSSTGKDLRRVLKKATHNNLPLNQEWWDLKILLTWRSFKTLVTKVSVTLLIDAKPNLRRPRRTERILTIGIVLSHGEQVSLLISVLEQVMTRPTTVKRMGTFGIGSRSKNTWIDALMSPRRYIGVNSLSAWSGKSPTTSVN